jgi:hypothetical protein
MPFPKGVFTDSPESNQPEGSYRYARNIIDANVLGAKENEDGFLDAGTLAPYTVNGIIPVEDAFVVFSTDNVNSEIGLVERTGTVLTYSQVYNDPNLSFKTDAPIKGEFRRDVNGNRVVSWIDDNNVPRIINIDDTSGVNDVNDIALFQDVENPSYSFTINDTGGSLPTCALIPITRYKNSDGSSTNWFVHDQVIYINDNPKSDPFNDDDGSPGGLTSTKSVNLVFSGCDVRYDTIVLGYIKSVNGVITALEARSLTNAPTVNVVLTGGESTTDVSLDEVLTSSTSYDTAKAITQLAGRLFLGNLTAEELPSLQPYVNGIKINYTTDTRGIVPNNTGVHKDNLPPVLIPGEVYALYLGIELNKGGWAFYPIPGRPAVATETDSLINYGLSYKRFQIDNTSNAGGALTNLGYWENSNELYPDKPEYDGSALGNYNLRNQPVRHHRMPTYDYLANVIYAADGSVGITSLPRILLNATNVIIPADVQSKIKRWKIFYAKKTNSNSLFAGSDILQFGVSAEFDSIVRWGTGGNWGVQGETSGSDTWDDFNYPSTDTIRGHCLDFLLDQGAANPSYTWFNYKLRCTNVNTQYTGFRGAGGKLAITGNGGGSNTAGVIDFTNISTTRSGTGFIKGLTNFSYLPANAVNGKFKTAYTEGVFVADITSPGTDFSAMQYDLLRTNSGAQTPDVNPWDGPVGGEDTMQMMYFRLLTDVHVSFSQETLVPLTDYASPSSTSLSNITGGNGFMCYMSYLACGPNNSNPDETQTDPFEEGTRVWKAYIGYSVNNWNYRYQTISDPTTYHYGKIDVRSLFTPRATVANSLHNILFKIDNGANNVQYDKDYSLDNEYMVGTIWSSSLVQETTFPNTIIYSPVQSADLKEFSWRTFLAADRFTMPKNKGEITNLQGFDNRELFIHHKFSLYKTRSNIEIATDSDDAYIKSANIFNIDPQEIIPVTGGYAGTQNKFACILSKAGYAFPDDIQGKIFLFNGDSLEEISSNGQRMFFRDFMKIGSANTDNPFNENGYTFVFDERFNRLVCSKKFGSLSWTWSYNPSGKYWVSSHDYIPDYMFTTVDNLVYGVNSQRFYFQNLQDNSLVKGKYYGSTIYPSVIDVVHNPEPGVDKVFTNLVWLTEVYPSTYTNGQPNSELNYRSTITHLTARTLDHCTGIIVLVPETGIDSFYTANVRQKNRTWYFNDIRDIATQTGFLLGFYNNFTIDVSKLDTNMEWYEKRKFIDKFVTCRYEFDNLSNNRLLFIDSNVEYRHA